MRKFIHAPFAQIIPVVWIGAIIVFSVSKGSLEASRKTDKIIEYTVTTTASKSPVEETISTSQKEITTPPAKLKKEYLKSLKAEKD